METQNKKGGISVETEHIFPIIKKWLYSEKEIFLRELVSNACDAITKLKRLASLGKIEGFDEQDFRITVKADPVNGTLTVSDNGIGMTEEEVEKYICQIALSGALDFIQKYEGADTAQNGIIGHFGLGFYSAFMVSDTVEIRTKSYTDAPAVHWSCNEAGEYTIGAEEKTTRGTDIILHITEDEKEFLTEGKLRTVLTQYCSFMPVEIYLESTEQKPQGDTKKEETEAEKEAPKPINDTNPLWQKSASECTEEEYNQFYQKVFHDYREPLFHIHINADYPLNFKGILYFPRLNHEYDNLEGQVKLYYNQVFVADNIKEVIPEYMLMLKGVLDCPELPLNVSRSYLQNSGYVAKVQAHIVKKVADKLNSMFTTDRAQYEKLWNDLKLFVEYGALRDRKFYDRVKEILLLPLTDGRNVTVEEYLEKAKEQHENTVYYTTDVVAQAQYISMFGEQGIEIAVLDKLIDAQFMQMLEQEKKIKFLRIDADVAGALKGDGETYENPELTALFQKVSGNEKLTVQYENLKDTRVPAVLNVSEQSRRMEDMMKMYRLSQGEDGGESLFPTEATLVVNANSGLIQKLGTCAKEKDEKAELIAKQVYTLALLAQRQLSAKELQTFLTDSFTLLENGFAK